MLTRRMILKYGFLGTGLLALGGVGLGLQKTKLISPTTELKVLSPEEFSILHAIAERLLPDNELFPPASTFHIAEKVDVILSTADDFVQAEIKQVLQLTLEISMHQRFLKSIQGL